MLKLFGLESIRLFDHAIAVIQRNGVGLRHRGIARQRFERFLHWQFRLHGWRMFVAPLLSRSLACIDVVVASLDIGKLDSVEFKWHLPLL
jgi:hypothetical protein